MKCFVASAVGYDDVDEIYDNSILPILTKLNIKPQRVDRVEHNEDVDDKIFQLIDSSDFLIADLTYARPSVYYEAGYAFGSGKPVIYITRCDHFNTKEDDLVGNLRVHFDLQMKNIIPWSKPNISFNNRFRKRINLIIKPALRKKQISKEKIEKEKEFNALSLNSQLYALMAKGKNLLYFRGFKKVRFPERRLKYREPRYFHLERFRDEIYQEIRLVNCNSVTKTTFSPFLHCLWPHITKEDKEKVTEYITLFLISAIRSVRKSTLRTNLSSYSPISDFIYYKKSSDRHEKTYIAVIGGVKSVDYYTDNLKRIYKQVGFG